MAHQILCVPPTENIAQHAATYCADLITHTVTTQGRCTITLCGGTTAPNMYKALAQIPQIPWDKVHVFWGDDRFINDTNEYSNQKDAYDTLLSRITIPTENIHTIDKNAVTPQVAAATYATHIQNFFGVEKPIQFDICINGMGPDGHTASLFPGAPQPVAHTIVAAVPAKLSPWIDRITLTMSVFNNARTILLLAEGAAKAERIKEVMTPGCILPAAQLNPRNGTVVWMVDTAVGALIVEEKK